MVTCSVCGYRNEGATAYCRRCAAALFPDTVQPKIPPLPTTRPALSRPVYRSRLPELPATLPQRLEPFWRRHWPKFFLGASVLLFLVMNFFYMSPKARMVRQGHRFMLPLLYGGPQPILAGVQTDFESWTERGGRLDTPLRSHHRLETATIELVPKEGQSVELRAREWIGNDVSDGETKALALPATDPSLAPAQVTMDSAGHWERVAARSARVGRLLPLLIPLWPPRILHRGDHWEEPVEWIEERRGWKLLWRGQARWRMQGFQNRDRQVCARLTYEVTAVPEIISGPAWAAGDVLSEVQSGGHGEAFFDTATDQLLVNHFAFDATLRIPLEDLRRLPEAKVKELWPSRTPGDLVLHLHDQIDLSRP